MKIRRPVAEDLAAIAQAIAADPDHAGQDAKFYLSTGSEDEGGELGAPYKGAECMVVEDEFGVIFYARLEHVLRVHLQFVPLKQEAPRERARLAIGIRNALGWLQQRAAIKNYRELIFSSKAEALIKFCEGKLGFRRSPNELVSNVARLARESSVVGRRSSAGEQPTAAVPVDGDRNHVTDKEIAAHHAQAQG